jgi:hypothetical protein
MQKEKPKQTVKQELSAVKIEQLNKQPILETSLQVSEDKKWVVYKTIITDIKPISYFEKVMANKSN